MTENNQKAKVFISCGQRKDTPEVEVARKVKEKFLGMGYDPYVAVEHTSLDGVKENTFAQLEESEYFVLIDFRRDKLVEGDGELDNRYRGSLFCHQELALASFLGKETLIFREEGVQTLDGISKFIQYNAYEFRSDRIDILDILVANKVGENGWNPRWKNKLNLSRIDMSEKTHTPAAKRENKDSCWYHIKVTNNHTRKTAVNCAMYLEVCTDLSNDRQLPLEPVEFKWRGLTEKEVMVQPGHSRYVNAFFTLDEEPKNIVHLAIDEYVIDWPEYLKQYTLTGPGKFKLDFALYSSNFPPSRGSFVLHIGDGKVQTILHESGEKCVNCGHG